MSLAKDVKRRKKHLAKKRDERAKKPRKPIALATPMKMEKEEVESYDMHTGGCWNRVRRRPRTTI